ncbi:MAG: phosphoribosylformylglycinamidine synthase subunit PurL, partial [Candidatus Eisenbacteria bacterium]
MTLSVAHDLAWTLEEAREPETVARRLKARGVSLEPDEVTLLGDLLGRAPRWAEAVLFGILWSEHCSYKSTRHLLSRLPTRAPQVILGPGEDAGVVALPEPCADLALVLAHESHNHPSQVLPVEGAATGVGGIVRDVGCMGAEVVGVLDSLRFGNPRNHGHVRDVIRGVVQGIADYGNALGVPNLGGDTVFDAGFDANCLVNVMAVGIAPRDGLLRSRVPEGPGPWSFVLAGKPTDESGFGGAAFASGELGGSDRRGAVQLPDPFLKRVLHVANTEVFARVRGRGVPAGFKDLGAGGVACATSELAAAGGRGARILVDDVHAVARPLPPEVLLCAETQERFCWVVPESFAAELCEIYNTMFALDDVYPGAGARVIGTATDDGRYVASWRGESVVDCPVEAITTGRRVQRPARRRTSVTKRPPRRRQTDVNQALRDLLSGLHLGSREYLFRHYDSEVQGRTWLRPGEADAAVFRVAADRAVGVALAVGGNPYWCEADPELGARHAVAEAARNVACTGARPWALTDCLNFGNPLDPEVMGDLEYAIEGLAAAAERLGGLASPGAPLPYVSGNVSLYNQTGGRAIPPSPIVMCAGVLRDLTIATGMGLARDGDFLVLVGEPRDDLSGSTFWRELRGHSGSAPPALDLEREARLQSLAVRAAEGRWVRAAHDVSDGGLLVAIAEMTLAASPGIGADADLADLAGEADAALFSERPGIVFAVSPERAARLFQAARDADLAAWPVGGVAAHGRLRARL